MLCVSASTLFDNCLWNHVVKAAEHAKNSVDDLSSKVSLCKFSQYPIKFWNSRKKSGKQQIPTQFSGQRSRQKNEFEKPWRLDTNKSLDICWISKVPRFQLKIRFLLEKPCFYIKSSLKTPICFAARSLWGLLSYVDWPFLDLLGRLSRFLLRWL